MTEPLISPELVEHSARRLLDMPFPLNWIAWICVVGLYLFWSAAFILMIVDARASKSANAPLAAVCAMLAFEVCFAIIWPLMKRNLVWGLAEWPWLVADGVLLWQLWRFSTPGFASKARLAGAATLSLACMAGAVSFLRLQDAMIPALATLAIVAASFAAFVLAHPDPSRVSFRGQGARSLGDVCTAGAVLLLFPPYAPGSLNNELTAALMLTMMVCNAVTLTTLVVHHRRA